MKWLCTFRRLKVLRVTGGSFIDLESAQQIKWPIQSLLNSRKNEMPRQARRKFWQTPRFKELQKEWEDRLKESGFIDAEAKGNLRQNALNAYRTQIHTVIENKRRYYELLGHYYHEEDFSCPVEKYVMERYASGISRPQIRKELKAAGKKNGRETIGKIVSFYAKKWGLKKKNNRW